MNRPPALAAYGHIRIVAPSARVNMDKLKLSVEAIRERGFQVSYGDTVGRSYEMFAGTDNERAQDLMAALCDPKVDAVFCARGGYGAMRLIPYLDEYRLRNIPPKIILGYSDITALHSYLRSLGWVTFHGPVVEMDARDWRGPNGDDVFRMLMGGTGILGDNPMQLVSRRTGTESPLLRPWVGGNLSLVSALIGTPYGQWPLGSVLFLEEVHESVYRIDRMMAQLYLSGGLRNLDGIVIGEWTECSISEELPHYNPLTVVRQLAEKAHVPLWSGFPSGHGTRKITIPLGWPMQISAANEVVLAQPAVEEAS